MSKINETTNPIKSLENEMVTYAELLKVYVKDNKEFFVKLLSIDIPHGYSSVIADMKQFTGNDILLREGTYNRLLKAQKLLKKLHPHYTFYVTYGYRSLEIQTEEFLKQLSVTKTFFPDPYDLYEEVHRFIAVPTVSGHPTGGAIDLVIKDEKTDKVLDFGSEQYNYETKDCYVFTQNISSKQSANRMLLRKLLIEVGFAPFDGEWWHFSYGDREWAFYYNKSHALYNQVLYKDLNII